MAKIGISVPFAQINLPLGGLGAGNIYYVVPDDAYSSQFIADNNTNYSDGSHSVFQCTMASASVAIQAALDACVANRNDYVIIMPSASNYTLLATLTMSKANVHLICPAGLGADAGAVNSARIAGYAGTNVITITGSGCEVAGLYIKNVDKYSAISIGALAHCTHIHHNHFPMTWTAGAQLGAIVSVGGTMLNIERNYIFNYTGGTGLTCANGIIRVGADGYLSRVSNNIIVIGAGATASKVIELECSNGTVNHNIITESGGSGATGGGTATLSIVVTKSCSVIGNRCAVATTHFSGTSGTTGISYCDNMNGVTEGTGGITAQLEA